jgi:hypothetical protein
MRPGTGAPASTTALTRRGLRLARLTIAYNVVEGVVAIGAGVAAGLVSVIGFGIDSGIETAAAVLVALRLSARLRHGVDRPGGTEPDATELRREHRTLRAVAVTFFLLAAWVTVEGVRALASGAVPETSTLALGVLIASLVVMPVLAAAKYRVGRALRDPLVLADAAETRVCVWLSVATLVGLLAFWWTGAAWIDPVAGFVVAAFAVHEGREAWEGELVEDHD